METKLNLYQKINAISKELNSVNKSLTVGYGSSSYKAVSEADVLNKIKPLEEQYGVLSYPCNREELIQDTISRIDKNGVEKKDVFFRIKTTYKFVNMENPEETFTTVSYGDGVDSQDKAPGKAMTYSDKYAIMKTYKIISGDDPDQNISEEHSTIPKATQKIAKKQILTRDVVNEYFKLGEKYKDIIKKYTKNQNKKLDDLTVAEQVQLRDELNNQMKTDNGVVDDFIK